MEILSEFDGIQIVATYSNADFGGNLINECLENFTIQNPDIIRVIPSLGNRKYLSFMRQVRFVIGNSSSGIIEAPTLGVPVVNIGDRQKGRYQCKNIIQTDTKMESIRVAIKKAMTMDGTTRDLYWGDGHTAERIVGILKDELIEK